MQTGDHGNYNNIGEYKLHELRAESEWIIVELLAQLRLVVLLALYDFIVLVDDDVNNLKCTLTAIIVIKMTNIDAELADKIFKEAP